MLNEREKVAFHKNTTLNGSALDSSERERLLKRILPSTPTATSPTPSRPSSRPARKQSRRTKQPRRKPIRTALKSQIHFFAYTLIHAFFGLYVRLRQTYTAVVDRVLSVLYHHHRTPELIQKDVRNLPKVPQHLSVILSLDNVSGRANGLEGLLNEVGEIAAWSASAGIPALSIYEKTGALKHYIPQTHRAIIRTLHAYFGENAGSQCPTVSIRAPNQPSFSPPETPPSPAGDDTLDDRPHLTILLISEDDGRNTMVDLTKTLTEMVQRQKISPDDITYELVDTEISESVMTEPDLLLLFGPRVVLDGYPPWQVRLTEIFHVPDNTQGVGYQVFLRALHRFAKAQMRFGR